MAKKMTAPVSETTESSDEFDGYVSNNLIEEGFVAESSIDEFADLFDYRDYDYS